jgi:hypothetical protein
MPASVSVSLAASCKAPNGCKFSLYNLISAIKQFRYKEYLDLRNMTIGLL